ncbi:XdhC family protein [Rhizobium deserti]|uniref:XdhC family protein n=1 Tax=Rhizobium deserti TaxID=2547961 RepID=A0A4R5UIK1_9HYPH|nr:XdhC family protein [Rhizobium deserti]TDK36640.1 XdhC family protein [Rhizobium deserti]
MQLAELARLNSARLQRRAAVVLTDISAGGSEVLVEGEGVPPALAGIVTGALRSGKAGLTEIEGRTLFINVHLPPPRLLVIGAVHISQALARMAPIIGYDLTIVDPRTAFATEERFEGVKLVADWPEDVLKEQPLDAYTALVAVTHDPKIDDFPLSEALKAGCFYVGALGSRKTHAKRMERLKEMGCAETQIATIAAPIGLDIGAATPAEIALAILAQVVEAFRRRDLAAEA